MEEVVLNPTTALAGLRGQITSYRKNSPLVPSLEGGLSLKCVEGVAQWMMGTSDLCWRGTYMYMYMLWYKDTLIYSYMCTYITKEIN